MEYADYEHILFERREANILWLTLNRPEVLNAAHAGLHTELVEIWNTIDRDPSVHVAVVTGAGRGFSAGGDLAMMEGAHGDHEEIIRILDEARDLVYNILHCSKPIVSAINDALRDFGIRFNRIPVTRKRIRAALIEAGVIPKKN